jgi:APA family basic amino acid/polyamine antiporter
MTDSTSPQHELARDLGVSHATSVVVGTIIGSGIFLVPAVMMQAVGTAQMVYAVWIVGGLLSLAGAMSYAELGAMRPQAGGEYVYLRDAYGPLAGFLGAWSWFLIAKPGSIASVSTGMMLILGTFPALGFLTQPAVTWPFAITWAQLWATVAIAFIAFINYIGVRRAGNFQLAFTVFKVAIVLGIITVAFAYPGGTWANFGTVFEGARGGVAGFMVALVAALWAYDGWNNVNMVAGEVRRPERNLPIALIAGVGLVGLLYMLMNAAVQYAMPAEAVAGTPRPATHAMLLALGASGAALFSAAIALQMMATLNGTSMSGARIPFAVARDGYLFSRLATVHPRFRTPSTAIVYQAGMAVVLVLFIGNFAVLISMTIFAEWLFYMATTSTLFVFRRREPEAARPFRTWGYPVVPALFIAASALLLGYTYVENLRHPAIPTEVIGPPLNSLSTAGTLIILAGVPVFYGFARRKRRTL